MAVTIIEGLSPDERGLGEPFDKTGWDNEPVPLKSLKKGDYFTLKDIPEPKESQVWVKDDWDRSSRKFLCLKFTDYLGNGREMDGNKMVYTNFIF